MRNADNNEINILDVDLASFGVPTDGTITSLSLRLTDWGEWGSADISAVAGINSAPVPEPVSMLLLGVGTLGLGVARFRKKRP
ncbi:MAG: PEP-CTERM sorting domain-containing protein [Deltaproteobacteria bacterium]|nr:PEP-CTERM sorting domain-containing protein [Deltaproteobacteria bacterium]